MLTLNNILGNDYKSYITQNQLYGTEYSKDTMHQIYGMQNDDDVTYYAVYGSGWSDSWFLGVRNGIIVSFCESMYSSYFRDIFPQSEFTETSPKRVNWYTGERFLIWKLDNCYLIVSTYESATTSISGTYLDNTVTWTAYIADADMNEWMEYSAVPDGF
jgi:hypothetical protein